MEHVPGFFSDGILTWGYEGDTGRGYGDGGYGDRPPLEREGGNVDHAYSGVAAGIRSTPGRFAEPQGVPGTCTYLPSPSPNSLLEKSGNQTSHAPDAVYMGGVPMAAALVVHKGKGYPRRSRNLSPFTPNSPCAPCRQGDLSASQLSKGNAWVPGDPPLWAGRPASNHADASLITHSTYSRRRPIRPSVERPSKSECSANRS